MKQHWRPWQPASGHRSGWRVVRDAIEPRPRWHPAMQEANGPSGKLRLFKSYETALAAANKLNNVKQLASTS